MLCIVYQSVQSRTLLRSFLRNGCYGSKRDMDAGDLCVISIFKTHTVLNISYLKMNEMDLRFNKIVIFLVSGQF